MNETTTNISNETDKQEVITLQIGNYSNFIGSHYWNIQEENYQYSKRENSPYEIEPEMLFRSNNNSSTLDRNIKYTPRLLLFDFKSNFGSMNSNGQVFRQTNSNIENNDLFSSGSTGNSNSNSNNNNNDNTTKIIKQSTGKPIDRNNLMMDNSNVNFEYWSDYLNVDYNERALIAIPDSLLSNAGSGSGDWNGLTFDDGFELMESNYESIQDLYQDNLRRMIEECDHLSGFQCLIDSDGIWGGVSTSILSHIQDEYSSKSIVTFGSTDYNESIENGNDDIIEQRTYNSAKTIQSIAPSSGTGFTDLYIPISSQRWWANSNRDPRIGLSNLICKTKYQTSAEIAASIDTATLYYRSNYSSQTISSFASHLTTTPSRKLVILSSSFPNQTQSFGFTYSSNKYGKEPTFPPQPLYNHPLMDYLSPRIENTINTTFNCNPLAEIISIRGIEIFKSLTENDRLEISASYDKISSLIKMYLVKSYNDQGNGRSVLNRSICNINQPFSMNKNQFPIFGNGHINKNTTQDEILFENPNTIIAHLQNSNLIHSFIKYLNNGFKLITNLKKMKRLIIDQDIFNETIENLNYLSDSYLE